MPFTILSKVMQSGDLDILSTLTSLLKSVKEVEKSRLTVVSREAKKKKYACVSSCLRDHYSELFTRMAAVNF